MKHAEPQKKIKSVRLLSGEKRQRRFPFMTDVHVLLSSNDIDSREKKPLMLKYSWGRREVVSRSRNSSCEVMKPNWGDDIRWEVQGGEVGRFSLANQVISLTNCGRTVAADLCWQISVGCVRCPGSHGANCGTLSLPASSPPWELWCQPGSLALSSPS